MNVAEYLLERGAGDAAAIEPLAGAVTYDALRDQVRRTARVLRARGIGKGDRVLLLAENGAFWVAAYLGTLLSGAIAVPLPSGIGAPDLSSIVASATPKFGFVDRRDSLESLAGIPTLQESSFAATISGASSGALPSTRPHDLAALMFTSGSTGKPRGVMVSHRNIIANTDSIIAALSLGSDDRIMCVLPFHYCFGTSLLHTHLRCGATVVIDNRFLFVEAVLRRLQQAACTAFAGVPTHYQTLLRKSGLRKMHFPRLRSVQQAGGHLAPVFVTQLREALPEANIFIQYGQTEATARVTTLPAADLARRPASIGRAIPGVTVSLLTHDGAPVRAGEPGEIVVEGENVTLGYWQAPEETATSFRNGRLHTGDLAISDDEGYLEIVGRAKDFLKCGGKRVSCRVIEDVLLDHEAVVEAAVVGVADDLLGECPEAYIVSNNGVSLNLEPELRRLCRFRLDPVFQPKYFAFVDSLPKNSSGKVLKAALKATAHKERVG